MPTPGKKPTTEEIVTESLNMLGTEEGKAVVVSTVFSKEELGLIDSFDAAMDLVTRTFGDVLAAHEQPLLGDGFRVADDSDKESLIGVPLLLLDWQFKASDFGQDQDWVLIHAVQRGTNGEAIKWLLSDGGTGIAHDLQEWTKKTGRAGGLGVKNGLRKSDYFIDPDTKKTLTKAQVREYMVTGKKTAPATTFYLDTSA